MLQAKLRNRAQQIAEAAAGDVDRNAVFIIPEPVAAAATALHAPRSNHTDPCAADAAPSGPAQAVDEKAPPPAPPCNMSTPRRPQIGLSPRYLPAVVAAGQIIIADSKDIPAPPPTRDRKKRELRPKDTVAALLTDASHTIEELAQEQVQDDELEAPDSPLSALVRRSSKNKAQTVRMSSVAINSVWHGASPKAGHAPAVLERQVSENSSAQSQAVGPENAAAAVEEAAGVPAPDSETLANLDAATAATDRVLSDAEIQERNRRTLDWFRNSESVNRASQISTDFVTRLSVLRRTRRGGSVTSTDSMEGDAVDAAPRHTNVRAGSKASAPSESGGRSSFSTETRAADPAAPLSARESQTLRRSNRKSLEPSASTIQ